MADLGTVLALSLLLKTDAALSEHKGELDRVGLYASLHLHESAASKCGAAIGPKIRT